MAVFGSALLDSVTTSVEITDVSVGTAKIEYLNISNASSGTGSYGVYYTDTSGPFNETGDRVYIRRAELTAAQTVYLSENDFPQGDNSSHFLGGHATDFRLYVEAVGIDIHVIFKREDVTSAGTTTLTIPDWTTDQGSANIHAGNYTDTNTQLPLIDDNTMGTALSTNVASAESVKAYVDGKTHLELGTAAGRALPGDTTVISAAQASAITANTTASNFIQVAVHTGYYSSSTSLYYEALTGYVAENASVTSYVSNIVAPYDGKVVRIAAYNSTTTSKTRTFKLFLNRQSSVQTGTDAATASYTTKEMPDLSPTDWVFSKGDSIAIQTTNSAYTASTNTTIVLEYDITT